VRLAVDTNVLVYAEGQEAQAKTATARRLLALRQLSVAVPVQVLGEFFRVMTGRYLWTREKAQESISVFRQALETPPTTATAFDAAVALAATHRLQIWDAIILAVAAEAGCSLLLSEDMQDGFAWSGVTVVNPFAEPTPAALVRAIQS
jgi:predicted nucleic acid-binding protein